MSSPAWDRRRVNVRRRIAARRARPTLAWIDRHVAPIDPWQRRYLTDLLAWHHRVPAPHAGTHGQP